MDTGEGDGDLINAPGVSRRPVGLCEICAQPARRFALLPNKDGVYDRIVYVCDACLEEDEAPHDDE